jgi:hypothetical protein
MARTRPDDPTRDAATSVNRPSLAPMSTRAIPGRSVVARNASSLGSYIPPTNTHQLTSLPNQRLILSAAHHSTSTGRSSRSSRWRCQISRRANVPRSSRLAGMSKVHPGLRVSVCLGESRRTYRSSDSTDAAEMRRSMKRSSLVRGRGCSDRATRGSLRRCCLPPPTSSTAPEKWRRDEPQPAGSPRRQFRLSGEGQRSTEVLRGVCIARRYWWDSDDPIVSGTFTERTLRPEASARIARRGASSLRGEAPRAEHRRRAPRRGTQGGVRGSALPQRTPTTSANSVQNVPALRRTTAASSRASTSLDRGRDPPST